MLAFGAAVDVDVVRVVERVVVVVVWAVWVEPAWYVVAGRAMAWKW